MYAVKQMELDLIELMYVNLSKRCRNDRVTREGFDLFFHSSGLIGEILFLKFNKAKNGTIDFKEFLAAFELMIKGSLRDRADVLFEIYDVNNTGGVKHEELLKIVPLPLPSSSATTPRNSTRCSLRKTSSNTSARGSSTTTSEQSTGRSRNGSSSRRRKARMTSTPNQR